MLPVETFADLTSFLADYDLGALKQASKQLSAVANQCGNAIRLFDFSDLEFQIWDSRILVNRFDSDCKLFHVCELKFESEEDLAEFIPEAFRNCCVLRLYGKITSLS